MCRIQVGAAIDAGLQDRNEVRVASSTGVPEPLLSAPPGTITKKMCDYQ